MRSEIFPLLIAAVLTAPPSSLSEQQQATLATSENKLFFCNEGIQFVNLSESSKPIELVLRNKNTFRLLPGMKCQFIIDISSSKYMVEFLSANVVPYQSSLEILDGYPVGRRMLREFDPHWSRQLFVSESDKIQVIFTTQEDYPENANSVGYRIRLTRFTGCPPDWHHLGDYCFTKSSASFLGNARGVAISHPEADYETAQAVCNRMRANLVVASDSVLKQSGISDFDQLMRNLSISNATWIGMSRSNWNNQVKLKWLDGTAANMGSGMVEISCHSDPSLPADMCKSFENFAYWTPRMLFLDQTNHKRQFACFASVKSGGIPLTRLSLGILAITLAASILAPAFADWHQ